MTKHLYILISSLLIVLLCIFIVQITQAEETPVEITDALLLSITQADTFDKLEEYTLLWESNDSFNRLNIVNNNDLWIQIPLPVTNSDDGLYVPSIIGQEFTLYDEKGTIIESSSSKTTGYHKLEILRPLDSDLSATTLYLHILANNYTSATKVSAFINEYSNLYALSGHGKMDFYIIGLLLSLSAILVVLISVNAEKTIRHIAYITALITITFGFFISYTDTNLMYVLKDQQGAIYIVFNVLTYTGAFLMLIHFKIVIIPLKNDLHYRRLVYITSIVSAFLTILFLISYITNISLDWYQPFNLIIVVLMYIFSYVVILFYSMKHLKSGISSARTLVLAYILYLITMLTEITIDAINQVPFGHHRINKWGLIILCLSYLYIYIYHYRGHLEQIAQLNREAALLGSSNIISKTRLPSHFRSIEAITRSIGRFTFSGESFTSAVIVIDEYDDLSDTYSSHFRDSVLIEIAKTIKDYVGENNFVGMWGDKDFLVIIYDLDQESCFEYLDALRRKIKFSLLRYNKKIVHVTATLGCSYYDSKESLENYIEKVKQAVFFGQHHGFDTTISFQHINQMDKANKLG